MTGAVLPPKPEMAPFQLYEVIFSRRWTYHSRYPASPRSVLYLCMIGVAGYGVFWWAKLLPLFTGGPNFGYAIVFKGLIYITPLRD